MTNLSRIIVIVTLTFAGCIFAAEKPAEIVEHNRLMDHGDGHLMDMDGAMVMGQNKSTLPPGCDKVSGDETITVTAGHKYARNFPGTMFGFSEHEWHIKPCTRLTVHFINEDKVRHQWMMHGLPKFIYDKGMFHLEVTGPASITGTLILPAEDRTYLVHCDIAQHMEKGMKGQLIVGKGSTPFPSIPGITDLAIPDHYGPPIQETPKAVAAASGTTASSNTTVGGPAVPSSGGSSSSNRTFFLGILLGIVGTPWLVSQYRTRYQGMNPSEVAASLVLTGKKLWAWTRHLLERWKEKSGKT